VVLDGDGDVPLLCRAGSDSLRIAVAGDSRLRLRATLRASCNYATGTPLADPVEVCGTFCEAVATIEIAENRPASVSGATCVLATVNGGAVPALPGDIRWSEVGTRIRNRLIAGTIRFGMDGRPARRRTCRQSEERSGSPVDVAEWQTSRSGLLSAAERQGVGRLGGNDTDTASDLLR
jgi:hypothetical protein